MLPDRSVTYVPGPYRLVPNRRLLRAITVCAVGGPTHRAAEQGGHM